MIDQPQPEPQPPDDRHSLDEAADASDASTPAAGAGARAERAASSGASPANAPDGAQVPRSANRSHGRSFDALCVHGGDLPLGMETPPLSPPIVRGSVFRPGDLATVERAAQHEAGLWIYGRHGNPTVDAFERAMAGLEAAESAVAAASGMGAIAGALTAHVTAGQRVVTTGALYGVTRRLLDERLAPAGVKVDHRTAAAAAGELPPDTCVLYTELISNPLLEVADLPALAAAAHAAGALLVVDATFATPALCRPLAHGADLVVHSATKYLGGHADLLLGVVAGAQALVEPVRRSVGTWGATPDPTAAWLALRGLRTLHLRMARHAANGAATAKWLDDHPLVRRVWHPSLPSHPTHRVATRMLGEQHGGMVAFEVDGGRPAVERFLTGLRMIQLAPSLADVATTVSHPASTSHRDMDPEARASMGITEGVVRLSCGVEQAVDILADIERGLRKVEGIGRAG